MTKLAPQRVRGKEVSEVGGEGCSPASHRSEQGTERVNGWVSSGNNGKSCLKKTKEGLEICGQRVIMV